MGNQVRVGIIGCGGFARGMHIPNLLRNGKYHIQATMDIDTDAAEQAQEAAGAEYATNELDKVLADGEVDAVIITTRHDLHADQTIQAAQAGKHVLCEKPMALNAEDVARVAAAVKDAGVAYTVGYNRGLAPMIGKARELLARESHKIMIYHRIQAPFPAEHWTHDPAVGGGRFVGEGCHIFDLMSEIVPAEPVSVFAAGGTFLDAETVHIPDSAIVTISYADGSVGTTLINSDGCPGFAKEATEIYCNGKAISIVNFQHMEYFGFEGHKKVTLSYDAVDKGHAVEIDRFADAVLNGMDSPNGVTQAARAAVISYKVMQSLESGAPVPIAESEYTFPS
jgi:predicted dehydrogenase